MLLAKTESELIAYELLRGKAQRTMRLMGIDMLPYEGGAERPSADNKHLRPTSPITGFLAETIVVETVARRVCNQSISLYM